MNALPLETQQKSQQYKYIPFLAMLHIGFGVVTMVLNGKLVATPVGAHSIAAFLGVFWFLEGDIIAEVYGHKIAMSFFWLHYFCMFIIAGVLNILISFHSPGVISAKDHHFIVFEQLFITLLIKFIAMIIAWRANAHLLIKWKVLTNGKYFWLRSLGASAIGEFLFYFIMILLLVILGVTSIVEPDPMRYAFYSYIFRVLLTAIFAIPCIFIAFFLKKVEGINIQETQNNFPILDLNRV